MTELVGSSTGPSRRPQRRRGRADPSPQPSVSYLVPPRGCRLPSPGGLLEYRNRSFSLSPDGTRVHRAWGPPGSPFAVGIEPLGSRWRVLGYGAGPDRARAAVRAMFNLDHPIEQFYRQVRAEPILAGMERRGFGLRPPRDASLYESLVHSILGQQLSVRAAETLRRRLEAATHAFVSVAGTELPLPPDPASLRRLGPDGLRAVGLSRAKSAALLSLARRESQGAFEPARFCGRRTAEIVAELDEEPGVGRWTSENAVLRGLGRPDVFVAGDLGVRYALEVYGPRRGPVREADARAWADRWYPGWGSYATFYLWTRWALEGAPRPDRGPRVPATGPRRAGTDRRPGAARPRA